MPAAQPVVHDGRLRANHADATASSLPLAVLRQEAEIVGELMDIQGIPMQGTLVLPANQIGAVLGRHAEAIASCPGEARQPPRVLLGVLRELKESLSGIPGVEVEVSASGWSRRQVSIVIRPSPTR